MNSPAEGRVTIVSGCPGTGKTTLARALSAGAPRGVHLVGDAFFAFLAHPVLQTRVEAHAQNAAVTRALAHAACAYAQGGYDVFVDGIVGPWFLEVFEVALRPLDLELNYVVLRARLDEAIQRGGSRPEDPVSEHVVRAMHPQFQTLGTLEPHAVDTTGLTPEALRAHVRTRLDAGSFALLTRSARLAPRQRRFHGPGSAHG